MFRLLAKETHIFSIPTYVFILLAIIATSNLTDFGLVDLSSRLVSFLGLALGYIHLNKTSLNRRTKLPLFLYTLFVYAVYPKGLDLGISITLLSNALILLILLHHQEQVRNHSYLTVGSILAINYLFLPTVWGMGVFVVVHIIATSNKIMLDMFRFSFGMILIFLGYFELMYLLDFTVLDSSFLPSIFFDFNPQGLYPLIFILILVVYSILDHFFHYHKKSPMSKFNYTFLLAFLLAQSSILFLYMGNHYEDLLLLCLPVVVILSRSLSFFRSYWMRELGLWLIIISLLTFKFQTYFL